MIKVDIVTLVASREPIPGNLKGLSNETLRNLQTEINPIPDNIKNIEYWPTEHEPQVYDHETQQLGAEILTAKPLTKTVLVSREVINLSQPQMARRLTSRVDEAKNIILARQKMESEKGTNVGGFEVGTDVDAMAGLIIFNLGLVSGRDNANTLRKINIKGKSITANAALIADLIGGIDDHRQACHDRGYEISAMVSAASTLNEVDTTMENELNIGWPNGQQPEI